MADTLTITVDDQAVKERLERLLSRARDMTPVMAEIGEIVKLSVKRNFEEQGRPSKWKPSRRVLLGGGQTLSDTGQLRDSITARAERSRVTVGTNVKYARILHLGGKTRPHDIVPKKAKALSIPGIGFRKRVRHPGSLIPARPFLMVQDADIKSIVRTLEDHLAG